MIKSNAQTIAVYKKLFTRHLYSEELFSLYVIKVAYIYPSICFPILYRMSPQSCDHNYQTETNSVRINSNEKTFLRENV